jgi:two-component system, cell cycle sensor histidine kinase and response regulator CckA
VTSTVSRGSTFRVYLPASEGISPPREKQVQRIVGGRENVLIVDDEKDNLGVLKEILLTLGYRVIAAEGGREAIDIYREKKDIIDLVITDMVMPEVDGGEVFDAIREINPQARVILCSGYSIESGTQAVIDRGCNGFIQKPFSIDELSRKLRDVLDK